MTTDLMPVIDGTYRRKLVPGYWLYDKLLAENPKELKKLIKEENFWFRETSKPGYQERIRESNGIAQEMVRADIISGEFAKRQQEMHAAMANQPPPTYVTPDDRLVLGISNLHDTLTKHEVRNAYRRQARKLHPDVGGDAEAFKHLYASYRTVLAVAVK